MGLVVVIVVGVVFVCVLVSAGLWSSGARLWGWSGGCDASGRAESHTVSPATIVTSVPAGTPPVRLHVLSQNVWCHYLVPAPGRLRRLEALAQHIATSATPYDIVMVQVQTSLLCFVVGRLWSFPQNLTMLVATRDCNQELFVMRLGWWVWSREFEAFKKRMCDAGLRYMGMRDSCARGCACGW